MPAIEEVKQALAIARKRDLNFGLCCGKVPSDTAFCTDRNKMPKTLLDIAKKEIKAKKMTANNRAYGTVRCEGKLVILSLDADPKGLIARPFRKYLIQELGINGSEVKVLDRLGEELSSAGEDEDAARTAVEPDGEPNKKQIQWDATAAKIGPIIERAVSETKIAKAAGIDASKLRADWAIANERAEETSWGQALDIVKRIMPQVKAAAAALNTSAETDAAPETASEDVEVDPVAVKARFDAVGKKLPGSLDEIKSDVTKLQTEIDRVCADLPGRSKINGAFDKLNKRLAQIETALITATQNGRKTPSANSLAQMKTLLGKADGILTGDPVMSNIDDNPFVKVKAQSRLRGLLKEIGTEMAAVD